MNKPTKAERKGEKKMTGCGGDSGQKGGGGVNGNAVGNGGGGGVNGGRGKMRVTGGERGAGKGGQPGTQASTGSSSTTHVKQNRQGGGGGHLEHVTEGCGRSRKWVRRPEATTWGLRVRRF